jgi:hypothetical protein
MTIYAQGIQTHQIFSIYDIHVPWKLFRQNLEPNIRTILIQQYSWLYILYRFKYTREKNVIQA